MAKYARFEKLQKYYMGQPVIPEEYIAGNFISDDFDDLGECELGGSYLKGLLYQVGESSTIKLVSNYNKSEIELYYSDSGELIENSTIDVSGHMNGDIIDIGIKYLVKTPDLTRLFDNCSDLIGIPEDLFKYVDVENFDYVFSGCSKLMSIPNNLFKYNTNARSFDSTFAQCTNIANVPIGLFDYTTNAVFFKWTFASCTSLISLPTYLFSKCKNVTWFYYTFYNCSSIISPCPLDNDDTPIYNRNNGKPGYTVLTDNTACFKNCTNMQDYSSIPSTWK